MRINLVILLLLFNISCSNGQLKTLNFSYRHFGTENGLAQNSIADAVFDKNGYLWISIRTENVFVYDGYRFVPCWFYKNGKKLAFKSATLFCNSGGDIFISHENGIHVRKRNTDSFVEISQSGGSRENDETIFIGETDHREICFYNSGVIYGLRQLQNGSFAKDSLVTTGNANVYFESSIDGNVKRSYCWYRKLEETACCLFDINKKKVIKKVESPPGLVFISFIAVDSVLYCIDKNFTLYKTEGQQWKVLGQLDSTFKTRRVQWQSYNFTNKNTGEIFVASEKYVYRFNRNLSTETYEINNTANRSMISKGGLSKVLQQDPHHLWFFTTAEGFYQLDITPKKFEHFKTDDGALNFVRSIYKDNSTGYVFSGLFYGGLLVYDSTGGLIRNFPLPRTGNDDRGGFCVNGIAKLNNSNYLIWYNAGRAYILNTIDWSLKSIINSGNQWNENMYGPTIDYAGFLSLGQNKFVSGYRKCIYFFTASLHGIQIYDSVSCTVVRPEGFYYATPYFYYGGVGAYYRYQAHTKKIDSIPIPFTTKVKWISADKNNRLWVATETGIAIMENNKVIKTLSTDDGLPDHYIYVAEPDNKGKMWCSSNMGLFSIDINNYVVTAYTTVDGLQSEEFNTGAFYRDSAQNLYFGGMNGLNFFPPEAMKENDETDVVHINFIGINDTVLYQYPNNLLPPSVEMSYKNPSLIIRYSALNYKTQGFNQYEYKLHTSDANWIDNRNNNELQLLLTPGEYVIQVRLKNLPLSVTQLRLSVRPPFYQTLWFILLLIVTITVLVALIVKRYIKNKYRKKIASLEMQQKIQAEKERIARDLHDDIGTKVNMLTYNVSLLSEIRSPEELKQMSERIKGTSVDMLQSLREAVWTLKQETITAGDVWTRFKNFIAKLQQTYLLIQFIIEEEAVSDKKINYNEALNLIRILQEAVSNAIKHSGCRSISCSMQNEQSRVSFTIRDDGKGFDAIAAAALQEGNGLANMQQRAHESGFTFFIHNEISKGTAITIKL